MWKTTNGLLQNIVEDGPVMHGDDLCRCQCHRMAGALHVKPCCKCCPHCRQNIVEAKFADHVKRCFIGAGRNP
jgi:hypothetical protein